MSGKSEIRAIAILELLNEVDKLRGEGWRLVQLLAAALEDGAELTYSFGMGLDMASLRIAAKAEEPIPSITSLYPGAFLYENEIRDLFGVRIERIRADWEGKTLDAARGKPFCKVRIEAASSERGTP